MNCIEPPNITANYFYIYIFKSLYFSTFNDRIKTKTAFLEGRKTMTINRTKTNFTYVTNGNTAGKIAKRLKSENRFVSLIRYKNYKRHTIEYYIFYYNIK